MIPPFVQQVLGVLTRALIIWAAGYLAAHGLTISDDQTTQIVAWATPLLAALAWSIYQKYRGRLKLLTAQVTPAGKSEAQIDAIVDAGNAPSVMTGKHEVPA